ncbi:MAG TPA: hypothetical protein DCS93_11975 [Microscillaceae bacterium]|nr:hypothetical protein [Microscillaceae bacterium]
MRTNLYHRTIFIVATLLLGACGNQDNREQTQDNDSTTSKSIVEIKPKTIEDYFQQLKAKKYFSTAEGDKIALNTLDIANGFMQISYNDVKAKVLVKATLKLWNKRKSEKDLVGIQFRHCVTQCIFKDPVFLEFDDEKYQEVTNSHYPANLKTYLKRRLADYAKTCTGGSPFNAALLPQAGTDIQLVAMTTNPTGAPPCPQALLGLLKYNGDGFTFIEPVGKEE